MHFAWEGTLALSNISQLGSSGYFEVTFFGSVVNAILLCAGDPQLAFHMTQQLPPWLLVACSLVAIDAVFDHGK